MHKMFVALALLAPLEAFAGNWGGTNFVPVDVALDADNKGGTNAVAEMMMARGMSPAEVAKYLATQRAEVERRPVIRGPAVSTKSRK